MASNLKITCHFYLLLIFNILKLEGKRFQWEAIILYNIVYTSNAGHTMEYAKLLARELGGEAYTLKEAKKKLKKKEEIIYLTWIFAGRPKKLKKALKRYKCLAIATVGMTLNKIDQDEIKFKYKLQCPLYYLPGGLDINRLKGLYKHIAQSVYDKMLIKLHHEKDFSDDEKIVAEAIVKGTNYVSRTYLEDILRYFNNIRK